MKTNLEVSFPSYPLILPLQVIKYMYSFDKTLLKSDRRKESLRAGTSLTRASYRQLLVSGWALEPAGGLWWHAVGLRPCRQPGKEEGCAHGRMKLGASMTKLGSFHRDVLLRSCTESIRAYICCKWVTVRSTWWNISPDFFPQPSWNKIKEVAKDTSWNTAEKTGPLAACAKERGEGPGPHGLIGALVPCSCSAEISTGLQLSTVETMDASVVVH